jgi:hypothetical protein
MDSLDSFLSLERIKTRTEVIDKAVCSLMLNLDWAEFGVFDGKSARYMLSKLHSDLHFYLFDSFNGLPEDWKFSDGRLKGKFKKGTFSLKGNAPKFDDNRAVVYCGLFKDTIPKFIEEHKEPLSLVHVDCDLYSSTSDVLRGINNLIVSGTILLFDEFYGYDNIGWVEHEYRAFMEFASNREFEYIARGKEQAVIRIK